MSFLGSRKCLPFYFHEAQGLVVSLVTWLAWAQALWHSSDSTACMPWCWVWTLTGGFLPPRFHVGARLPQLGRELADGTFPLLQRAQQLEGVGSLV